LPNISIEYTIPLNGKKAGPHSKEVLLITLSSSPDWLIDRTFTITLKLTYPVYKHKILSRKSFRNPIILAQEMQKLLDEGIYSSKADLARNLEISRARVTQMLNLLSIDQELQNIIISLGDPLPSPIITERKLKSLIDHPSKQRKYKNILQSKHMLKTSK